MAKKKVSHAQNEKPAQKESVKSQPMDSPPPPVDSEKLESLKSLNQMLLKEAVGRRHQVDSLLQSKGYLETELTRSNSEKEALGSELALLVERAAELEVERKVVAVFVAMQVDVKGEEFNSKMKGLEIEMGEWKRVVEERESEIVRLNGAVSEIEGELGNERAASRRVRVERDVFEHKLNRQIEEDAGLRANLTELGDKMKEIEREIEESGTAYNSVVKEREDMKKRIKILMGERDLSERGLKEWKKLIDKMKEEISMVVREKEEIEKEKNREMVKRQELENVVTELNEMVAKLQIEEVKLQKIVSELDKKCVDGEEKLEEMGMEVARLVEEMMMGEKMIQGLIDEKTVTENNLGEALKHLAKQKCELESFANEKTVMLEAKTRVEEEVGELRSNVDELKAAVLLLEDLNRADVEKIRSLESEVEDSKSKLKKVFVEKDGLERCLDQEKKHLAKQKCELESLANEKTVILEAKTRVEGEVGDLQSNVDELKAAVLQLEGLNRADVEKIRSLESEVGDYKSKLKKVYVEKDGLERCLDQEKKNALMLKENIEELEKKIEESHKAAEEVKAEKAAILSEKVKLESRCGVLKEEIASLHSTTLKSRAEIESMKRKVELADTNSQLVLNMLKGTSAFCCKAGSGGEVDNVRIDEEVLKLHAMEMEAIKSAFKSKAATVEEMKSEVEQLQSCVVDEKKKSFWAVVSSATALFAAMTLAYVARGH